MNARAHLYGMNRMMFQLKAVREVLDADLEYSPYDIPRLVKPILSLEKKPKRRFANTKRILF